MTSPDALRPLPEGWHTWEAGVSTPDARLWCAENNFAVVHVAGDGRIYCYTSGPVPYDDLLAVLAHLRHRAEQHGGNG